MTTRGSGGGNAYPRYTTYPAGELGDALRSISPAGATLPPDAEAIQRGSGTAGGQRRYVPVKAHEFKATLPDGTEGTGKYERLGPAFHRFDFADAQGHSLPRQWHTERLDGSAADIERAGKEIAAAAFRAAIAAEKRDYFCRASESPTRKKRPERYQMDAMRAKELAGRYALCLRLGEVKLLPIGGETFATLDEANSAWRKWREEHQTESNAVTAPMVACCNRLDRCWEQPRYNPLYSETRSRVLTEIGTAEQGG